MSDSDLVPPEELRAFFAEFAPDEPKGTIDPNAEKRAVLLKEWREQQIVAAQAEAFERSVDPTQAGESPIESMLIAALWMYATVSGRELKSRTGTPLFAVGEWLAYAQLEVGPYRADIGFVCDGEDGGFVVECDGHGFHERTPAQALHDRQRDRWMQANGWEVMRFTGREIVRSADACASEVVTRLHSRRRG